MLDVLAMCNDTNFMHELCQQRELLNASCGNACDTQPTAMAVDPSLETPRFAKGPRPAPAAYDPATAEWTCERCGRVRAAIFRCCDHCGADRPLYPAVGSSATSSPPVAQSTHSSPFVASKRPRRDEDCKDNVSIYYTSFNLAMHFVPDRIASNHQHAIRNRVDCAREAHKIYGCYFRNKEYAMNLTLLPPMMLTSTTTTSLSSDSPGDEDCQNQNLTLSMHSASPRIGSMCLWR